MLKFYYNGIKSSDEDGLQKAHYSFGNCIDGQYFTIYARNYKRFSKEISQNLIVKNDSDSMTDYFENDRIKVEKNHPLMAEVMEAYIASIKKPKNITEELKQKRINEVLEWANS